MSDELRKQILSHRPPPVRATGAGHDVSAWSNGIGKGKSKRDYSPVSWDQYFDKLHDVKVDQDIFRVYECGSSGPVCFFLHGGGFSGLSWAILSKTLCNLVNCRCVALDSRGHGGTQTGNDQLLSADDQANDIGRVVTQMYGEDAPPIILIGHSMGGAIAIHAVVKNLVPSVAALIVIDVVEGTALDALTHMQSFLRGRPSVFNSLQHAIEYCVRTGQIKNVDSARVSVAGQVKRLDGKVVDNRPAVRLPRPVGASVASETLQEEDSVTEEDTTTQTKEDTHKETKEPTHTDTNTSLTSDDHKEMPPPQAKTVSAVGDQYGWRIDLTKTEQFWKGWFEGMSKMFLSCSVPRLLLLAGIDRLDKDLTVGQMQGKFQMQVMPQCGHVVHEDSPDKVADAIASFLVRNKLAEATGNFQRTFPCC